MDDLRNLTSPQNAALVVFAFLQADCRNSDYKKELFSLGQDTDLMRDINCNNPWRDSPDDGDLETDGHLVSCITASLGDIQPSVELQLPRNHADAAAIQQVAAGLREIAAQFEHNHFVAQATQNLHRNITVFPSEQWKDYLTQEVDRLINQGVGLEHLAQERVIAALALTLVKGVCEQAPQLLRNLFRTALQYISSAWSG
ncbi:uncharacterized protein LOC118329918 isoform X2 [Morone saxatilis]|uniref:uncharacterized protein LOC118329918 isoform X2 n=1 Tax=Morone saxatilis TaxID=34816 RepID=UPI0015E224F2|nr:uncharacterized protein LOC118329918 isoform X2 [Morone saxatilis]